MVKVGIDDNKMMGGVTNMLKCQGTDNVFHIILLLNNTIIHLNHIHIHV